MTWTAQDEQQWKAEQREEAEKAKAAYLAAAKAEAEAEANAGSFSWRRVRLYLNLVLWPIALVTLVVGLAAGAAWATKAIGVILVVGAVQLVVLFFRKGMEQ